MKKNVTKLPRLSIGSKRIREQIAILSCDAVDIKPIQVDWEEIGKLNDDDGDPENHYYQFTEAMRCEKCGTTFVNESSNKHDKLDPTGESECDGWVNRSEGPMMNYWYPVKIDDVSVAAVTIVDSPLCVVTIDGVTGLALTGGGMDCSWEICEAFMLLGFLPPVHFADLPAMGRPTQDPERWTWVVHGVLRSCAIMAGWAKDRASRLRQTVKDEAERAAKKKKVA